MAHKQSGFTLIELAIVLMISGLLLGGSMMMMKPYVEGAKINATREKLNKISDALALFQQNYHRLPCPANPANAGVTEPFGSPIRSGVNGTNFVTTTCAAGGVALGTIPTDYVGIVPFKAIGLTEDNIRDGYGNLITYAVAPVLAEAIDSSTKIHNLCNTNLWVDSSGHLNPRKARFCCPYNRTNADIKVLDGLGSTTQVYSGLHSSSAGDYKNPDGTAVTTSNFDTHVIAFVLVSHGKNGDGAYIKQPPGATQNPVTANAGAQESENRNGDLIFVDRGGISKTDDTNYFDDIIVWRTNDQVVSNFGNESCGRP